MTDEITQLTERILREIPDVDAFDVSLTLKRDSKDALKSVTVSLKLPKNG